MARKKCVICKVRPSNRKKSDHHLVPRFNGSRKNKVPMCVECHRKVHSYFSDRELYERYHEVDILKEELHNRIINESFIHAVPMFDMTGVWV